MPDWTYHTVFKPFLTRMPYAVAEKLVFGAMGMLAGWSPGRLLIRMMGHASPDEKMRVRRGSLSFAAPTALATGVDSKLLGTNAIVLFGFGLIEIGPIGSRTESASPRWVDRDGAIEGCDSVAVSCADARSRLEKLVRPTHARVVARLEGAPDQLNESVRQFASLVDGFSIDAEAADHILAMRSLTDLPIYVRVHASAELTTERRTADGFILQQAGEGLPEFAERIADTRREADETQIVAAQGNVTEPADAIPLTEAGADLIMLQSGFAEAGPGLPKRINRLLSEGDAGQSPPNLFSPTLSFFWSGLMGIALFVGGMIAVALGLTRVLLPYDEEYLGMFREELCGFSEQILPFMSHDRVTLAGTMLSLGTIYAACAVFAERTGQRWARTAVLSSAFVGFLSFFLFLGFGYFDPLHAFVAAILFQFILLGLRSPLPPQQSLTADLYNDSAWRRALWGQLIFVLHGAAILVAGVVICSYGVTTVFVREDLEFMQLSRQQLLSINPRLVPLVAHDRASFGGMLMSTGVMVLLSAMWGWRRGQSWLWYTLAAAGTLAYGATIAIHWGVGYTSLKHLVPAYAGLAGLWLGLALSRVWMCGGDLPRATPDFN